MLRGASAEALAELGQQAARTQTLDDAATLGTNLFGVASVVRRDAALRRALTERRSRARRSRGWPGRCSARTRRPAMKLVEDAVSRRWIGGKDLPDALEQVAVAATVRSAGAKGKQVGDELFAVLQMIDATRRCAERWPTTRAPPRTAARCSSVSSTARPSRPPACSWARP